MSALGTRLACSQAAIRELRDVLSPRHGSLRGRGSPAPASPEA